MCLSLTQFSSKILHHRATVEIRKQETVFKVMKLLIMLICELFCESVFSLLEVPPHCSPTTAFTCCVTSNCRLSWLVFPQFSSQMPEQYTASWQIMYCLMFTTRSDFWHHKEHHESEVFSLKHKEKQTPAQVEGKNVRELRMNCFMWRRFWPSWTWMWPTYYRHK